MSGSRDQMLDSAITLFRERGVAATSLRDVVAHSGAPRGSIYHHFPGGKDQLAQEATERAGAFIASLLESLTDQDPAVAIDKFIGYWRGALKGADFRDGCPAAAAALYSESPAAVKAAGAAFSRWEDLLSDALERRGRTPDEAASVATLTIAAIEGALILSRAQGSDEPLRRVGERLHGLLADR